MRARIDVAEPQIPRADWPRARDFERIVGEVEAFWDQPEMAGLEAGIASKKPIFRAAFAILELLSRSTLGNALALLAALSAYRGHIAPRPGAEVFAHDPRNANRRALARLDPAWKTAGLRADRGAELGVLARLRAALAPRMILAASRALARAPARSRLAHAQAVLAAAAAIVFARPFPRELRAVCAACDHNPLSMALFDAARRRGVATIYVQHAPVTEIFPPLAYDLAALFDRASQERYRAAARRRGCAPSSTRVVHLPAFDDAFRTPQLGRPPHVVGVCASFLPDFEALDALFARLAKHPNVASVALRRHPRCRHDWSRPIERHQLDLRPSDEPLSAFARGCDWALAPSSGVVIELLHSGAPTVFASGLDRVPDDYYRFAQSGLVPKFDPRMLDDPSQIAGFFDQEWKARFASWDPTVSEDVEALRAQLATALAEVVGEARPPASTNLRVAARGCNGGAAT